MTLADARDVAVILIAVYFVGRCLVDDIKWRKR